MISLMGFVDESRIAKDKTIVYPALAALHSAVIGLVSSGQSASHCIGLFFVIVYSNSNVNGIV